jgi:protein-S-isoprenylcysteine O-methyltransferase Ste14
VTAGPYRWMRHPLYMGFVIEAIGVSLIMASWFIGLMAALQWGLLVYRIRTEEEKLCACFGDQYRHYRQGTGRFFPKLTR